MSSNKRLNVSNRYVAVSFCETEKSFAQRACERQAHTPHAQRFLTHARTLPVMQFYDSPLQFEQHMRCVLYDTPRIYTRALCIKSILADLKYQ